MTKEGKRESGEAIPNTHDYFWVKRFFERMKKMDDVPERIELFHSRRKEEFLWVIMNLEGKTKSSIFSHKSSCRDALVEKSLSFAQEWSPTGRARGLLRRWITGSR